MNREIKIRFWNGREKHMLYPEFWTSQDLVESNDWKTMQYVGLKDKNGREIYEGDIIQYKTTYYGNHKTHTTLVEWKDDLEHDGFGEPLAMGYIFHGIENEVIGNIFENPNLLNKENEKTNITSSI